MKNKISQLIEQTLCCFQTRMNAFVIHNKGVSEMQAPLVDRHEPAGNQNKATKYALCFWT